MEEDKSSSSKSDSEVESETGNSQNAEADPPITDHEPYEYLPLDTRGQHIRLFQISQSPNSEFLELHLQHFDLRAAPPFRAVSYVWGPPPATRTVLVGGKALKIRDNLEDFFRIFVSKHAKTERFSGSSWLWADQVCVNQGFNSERNHQVQMMGQIFGKANEVLVWLGADKKGESAFGMMESIRDGANENNALIPTKIGIRNQRGLIEFANNPYWDRLWIVQEIVLAQDLVLFLHRAMLDGDKFERFCRNVMGFNSSIHNCKLFDLIAKQRLGRFFKNQPLSGLLLDACFATLFSQCEDPRDKIYGLQGLLARGQRATIDYSQPTEQVLLDAAVKICNTNATLLDYELAWYLSQISFGMGLFDTKEADNFFVNASLLLNHSGGRKAKVIQLLSFLHESLRKKMWFKGSSITFDPESVDLQPANSEEKA